jgi:GT2 family glycosyltransferase
MSADSEVAQLRTVTAVVLAYGPEPLLVECVDAILDSTGVEVDVVLVDNGCTTDAVDILAERPRTTILRPEANAGFAGGCNLGARAATGDVVAFVNGDAVVRPDALEELAKALDDDTVGMASGSLHLYDSPDRMNSAGNPLHFLGLSWAGGLGDPITEHTEPADVTGGTGAACALRRDYFLALGGFWETLFAYLEDTELSLRIWERGQRVRYVPTSVAHHRYEFSRNPRKTFLLERNRALLLLTHYERRTLTLLAPALLALDLVILALALRQGWAGSKVRSWWWVLRHRSEIRDRRRAIHASRLVSDRSLLPRLLTAHFTAGAETGLSVPGWVNRGMEIYWRAVVRLLR